MKWNRENLWAILSTNDEQLAKALVALYDRQTEEEQASNQTTSANGIGFNGVDAPFLSSCAEGVKKYGRLTPKQVASVRRTIKKYVGQLVDIANAKQPQEVTHV